MKKVLFGAALLSFTSAYAQDYSSVGLGTGDGFPRVRRHDPNHSVAPLVSDSVDVFSHPNATPSRRLQDQETAAKQTLRDQLSKMGAITIQGEVLSVVSDSAAVLVNCPGSYFESNNQRAPACYLTGTNEIVPNGAQPARIKGVVLLLLPKGYPQLVDDDSVSVIAVPAQKVYHYTSAAGLAKTVRVYWLGVNKS